MISLLFAFAIVSQSCQGSSCQVQQIYLVPQIQQVPQIRVFQVPYIQKVKIKRKFGVKRILK